MASPRDQVLAAEKQARLLPGANERFSGWGVMGLPFRSGDVFAARRFPASSIGPGYTSVWYRNPQGHWTFYADAHQFSYTWKLGSTPGAEPLLGHRSAHPVL
jgi:hypothetical protein